MEWIPYDQFEDIEYMTEGGFSVIYKTTWVHGCINDWNDEKKEFISFHNQKVILKCLLNSGNPNQKFFEEAMNYSKLQSEMIAECYGVTRCPKLGNYMMVINYLLDGNLRDYLEKNHRTLTLKDRVTIFYNLIDSLDDIHEKNLVHCDLHSGNILMQQSGACYITDLGLCGPINEESSDGIYGIMPYIAPEVLNGKTKNKESDIYGIGMLMWEIFSGHPLFDDRPHNGDLVMDICSGYRPPILRQMPKNYVRLMQQCWSQNPSERPNIKQLLEEGKEIFKSVYESEELLNVNFGNGYEGSEYGSSASSVASSDNENEESENVDRKIKKIFKKLFKKTPKRKKSSTSINSISSNKSNSGSSNISSNDSSNYSSNYCSSSSGSSSSGHQSTQQKYTSHQFAFRKSRRLNEDIPDNVNHFTLQYNFEIRASLEEHVRQQHHHENADKNEIVSEEYQDCKIRIEITSDLDGTFKL